MNEVIKVRILKLGGMYSSNRPWAVEPLDVVLILDEGLKAKDWTLKHVGLTILLTLTLPGLRLPSSQYISEISSRNVGSSAV